MSKAILFGIHRNRLIRQCLIRALESDSRFEGFEAKEVETDDLDGWAPEEQTVSQVALIDLGLPGRRAVTLTQTMRDAGGGVVLLVAAHHHGSEDQSVMLECIEAGARGYVLEDASLDELRGAIESVLLGRLYCSAAIVETLMQDVIKLSRSARWENRLEPRALTDRELEILHWIAEGLSNKQVARKLSLSIYTVKNHVHRILSKLNAADRTHAVRHALDEKLLPLGKSRTVSVL